MQNQKGNVSVGFSLIIVMAIVGLIIYVVMRNVNTSKEDPLDGIKKSTSEEVKDEKSSTLKEQSPNNKKTMETNKRLLQNFTPVSKVASLEKQDIVVGSGAEVPAGATVSVHYTGAVAATGEVFQSSKDFGTDPITFPLSGVIKGWTDGIPGMKVGGTRRLVIPAAQAYGATPPPGSGIPPNADLVFDVELVAVK